MAGACFTHIRAGEWARLPVPVVLLLGLAGLLVWSRRR